MEYTFKLNSRFVAIAARRMLNRKIGLHLIPGHNVKNNANMFLTAYKDTTFHDWYILDGISGYAIASGNTFKSACVELQHNIDKYGGIDKFQSFIAAQILKNVRFINKRYSI